MFSNQDELVEVTIHLPQDRYDLFLEEMEDAKKELLKSGYMTEETLSSITIEDHISLILLNTNYINNISARIHDER